MTESDAKIQMVYEAIANMLPVEGRDYVLNAHVKEDGKVGFKPVAYSEIGKIWCEYLARNLGDRVGNKERKQQQENDQTT